MTYKVSIFIESVILGVGASNRGGSCAILVLDSSVTQNSVNPYRKVITRYDGQGVKQADIVKNIARQALALLTMPSIVAVRSSSGDPGGIETGTHIFDWRRIGEATDGWQIRAAFASWEVALGGEATDEIMSLAASGPADVPKGVFIYAGSSSGSSRFRGQVYGNPKPAGRRAGKGVRALLAGAGSKTRPVRPRRDARSS